MGEYFQRDVEENIKEAVIFMDIYQADDRETLAFSVFWLERSERVRSRRTLRLQLLRSNSLGSRKEIQE